MGPRNIEVMTLLSNNEISEIIARLGEAILTKDGHDFDVLGSVPIREAAERSVKDYPELARRKPALALISVVLAANRKYNSHVKKNIARIQEEIPDLSNFAQLREVTKDQKAFYKLWGHKDEKKYKTLLSILSRIEEFKARHSQSIADFDLLHEWAKQAELSNKKEDILGSLRNVGVATFQHLRMVFGIDTVKPDQRVLEVLRKEFRIKNLSAIKGIRAVEEISKRLGLRVILVDQILVKYGSSYYVGDRKKKYSTKEVARNLKALGVENHIISQATGINIKNIVAL